MKTDESYLELLDLDSESAARISLFTSNMSGLYLDLSKKFVQLSALNELKELDVTVKAKDDTSNFKYEIKDTFRAKNIIKCDLIANIRYLLRNIEEFAQRIDETISEAKNEETKN